MAERRLDQVFGKAQERGFIGPGDLGGHVRHAEAFLTWIDPEAAQAVDLGTGGGLPGLVLAHRLPQTRWVFVESGMRRAEFLTEAAEQLGLENVRVINERAELVGRSELRGTSDLVTARLFGPPAVVAECAAPLLRQGGRLLVSEPPEGSVQKRWPPEPLAALGFGPAGLREGSARLVELDFVGPCPERYPRPVGRPAKRPLF